MFPTRNHICSSCLVGMTLLYLTGCIAVSRTPPLSNQGDNRPLTYQGIAFTSGTFKRPHRVVGVVQMTQEGFRHYLAGEVNEDDTQPAHMMQALALYAARHGADGLQRFSLIDENPRSQEERTAQKVTQTIKILGALGSQNKEGYQSSIQEGETTRFHIKGELVAWIQPAKSNTTDQEPLPPTSPSTAQHESHQP